MVSKCLLHKSTTTIKYSGRDRYCLWQTVYVYEKVPHTHIYHSNWTLLKGSCTALMYFNATPEFNIIDSLYSQRNDTLIFIIIIIWHQVKNWKTLYLTKTDFKIPLVRPPADEQRFIINVNNILCLTDHHFTKIFNSTLNVKPVMKSQCGAGAGTDCLSQTDGGYWCRQIWAADGEAQ